MPLGMTRPISIPAVTSSPSSIPTTRWKRPARRTTSPRPLAGTWQDDSGGVHVVTPAGAQTDSVMATQDPATGDITVMVNGTTSTLRNVSALYVGLQGNGGSVDAARASPARCGSMAAAGPTPLPAAAATNTIYAGSGTDTDHRRHGSNEIYGGAGNDTIDGSAGQNNWIQAGSGGGDDYRRQRQRLALRRQRARTPSPAAAATRSSTAARARISSPGAAAWTKSTAGRTRTLFTATAPTTCSRAARATIIFSPITPLVQTVCPASRYRDSQGNYIADGNVNANGSPYSDASDYQAVDPAYGGSWTFDNTDSGPRLGGSSSTPMAVYANWQPGETNYGNTSESYTAGTQWATNAVYAIYDSGGLLGSVVVNQQNSPGNQSPVPHDRDWALLGVWNVTGTLYVKLESYSSFYGGSPNEAGALCMGQIVVQALWPTVSIRAANATVNSQAVDPGAYADFAAACNPVSIPVEGQGARVQLNLQASMDPLYNQVQNPSQTQSSPMSDWQFILPSVSGADFGTQRRAARPCPASTRRVTSWRRP